MSGRPNTPLLPPEQAGRLLDDVIFTRVVELIDLPRLYDLEALLALQLEELLARTCGEPEPRARALAKAMIDRALLRVARTPRRWMHRHTPTEDDACDICGNACEEEQSTNT